MRDFLNTLITHWWGIIIIVLLSVFLLLVLSVVFYNIFFKRFYDIIFSALALIFLSPLLLLVALLVKIKLGSPIIFKQQRPGKNCKIFTLHKFRTMTNKRNGNGEYLPDSERLTKFGKFLRISSIDELPELWDILRGKMSFIGPRPLLVEYLPLYNEEQKSRHKVRPGLSGLAQVKGRNSIKWEDRFKIDIEYVSTLNFFVDLKIVFLTIKYVFLRKDINSNTSATMECFKGTK